MKASFGEIMGLLPSSVAPAAAEFPTLHVAIGNGIITIQLRVVW
jgi:hypothetical protein